MLLRRPSGLRLARSLLPRRGMSWEIGFVFAVGIALVTLFIWERWPIDQVAIAVPVVLLAGGILTPEEAISGLSHFATVTVAAMLALSVGLVKTGAVPALGRLIRNLPIRGETPRLMVLCAVAALVSPFLNNTAVVAVFLPVFLSFSREMGSPPSHYLIPLSYSAILGGTITLLGTSTNLIVWGMARSRGFDDLSIFSIAPLGVVYLGVGFAYLFTVGRWLLPRRAGEVDLSERYDVRDFVTELRVQEGSDLIGTDPAELDGDDGRGVRFLGLGRGDLRGAPGYGTVLRAGDVLYVQGSAEDLLTLAEKKGLSPPSGEERPGGAPDPDSRGSDPEREKSDPEGRGLVEAVVAPGSRLVGRRIGSLGRFRAQGVAVIALQRHGSAVREGLGQVTLRSGDLLLLQGPPEALHQLADQPGILPLGEVDLPDLSRPRAFVAVAIMAGVVLVSATGLAPILSAALAGVVLMLFTGCVRLEELYRDMDWMVVFLLAGLIPLGLAMEKTGAAAWIVSSSVGVLEPLPAIAVVAGFYLLTSILTEVVSNNATAVVLTPVAIAAAEPLGISTYALLVAVMFGASASFMTPTGYQTNTMIFGPGGYRFTDYLRVGVPLNLLLVIVAALLIPFFWG